MRSCVAAMAALASLPGLARADAAPVATLRPVVVTPQPGLAQSAFDTPASVDVIPAAAIQAGGLQVNLSESLLRAPGVVALNRQNYAQDLQVSIRGYGARSTFGVRGLRLYVDGIPATMPDGQGQISHIDLPSADRIEVLRGPFSALYGNSSGGVISVFTADGTPTTVLDAGTAVGTDGVRRVNAQVSGTQGAVDYRLDALRFETDGLRDHSAAERQGFNGKFNAHFSADTRLTVVFNGVDLPGTQDPLGLTRTELQADPRQASPAALQFDTRKSASQLQAGAVLQQRVNASNDLKLTAWRGRRGTEQFQSIPVATQAPPTHPGGVIALDRDYQGADGQWVYRTRLGANPFALTAGLATEQLDEHRQGFQNFDGAAVGVMGARRRDEDNNVRSFDQYLQGSWTSEHLSLTAGLRHSQVKFESRDNYVVPGNADDSGAVSYRATTPVAGAVWHVNEQLNFYAAAGKGFETPTFNELAYRPGGLPGLNFTLQPARSRQWELGVKAEPLAHWRVNAAVFQARTSDELVVQTNSGGRSTFQNASATRRRGLELSLDGRWGRAWSTQVAATWLDATYSAGFLTCASAPCAAPGTPVAAGSRLPGIPRAFGFAELAWKQGGVEAAAEYRYLGRIAVDDRNTDFTSAAGVFALRLGLEQKWDRWLLREFVRVDNVLDRQYVGSVIVNEGNRRFFEPAPGRSWLLGVQAGYAF